MKFVGETCGHRNVAIGALCPMHVCARSLANFQCGAHLFYIGFHIFLCCCTLNNFIWFTTFYSDLLFYSMAYRADFILYFYSFFIFICELHVICIAITLSHIRSQTMQPPRVGPLRQQNQIWLSNILFNVIFILLCVSQILKHCLPLCSCRALDLHFNKELEWGWNFIIDSVLFAKMRKIVQ